MTSAAARSSATRAPGADRTPPAPGPFVGEVLARYAGHERTVVVTVPAPAVPLPVAWSLLGQSPGFLWEPPEGPGYAACGAVRSAEPEGHGRGAQGRAIGDAVGARMEAVYHPAVWPVRPRWFGGLSFAPGSAADDRWAPFGDGRFVLPRWCYGRTGDRAWLSLAADGERLDAPARARAVERLAALLRQLAQHVGRRPEEAAVSADRLRIEHLPEAQWAAQVDAIREAIDGERVRKVVAARRSMVEGRDAIDPSLVLTRLGRRYPGCTRFAVRMGEPTFVGATPEWLVRRNGSRVLSEAMAGSVAHGSTAELLASDKDRREHAMVVDTLEERLAPYCWRLERGTEPRVRELPNVAHLHTPVTGELRERTHVLDLVDALHPTPAVGGVPVEAAMEWIARHEPHPRGWYGGPVGWFDADGDGEFVVALRSGLVCGRHAWAYAGAGIVRGSEPQAEYAETELKLRPLLEALGDAMPRAGEPG